MSTSGAVDVALVERTYQALLGVVKTTAVSRKVLTRPPFTFLHKLLVETLGEYDLFTDEQLQFALLNTKQAKAAFLTRALAFVTFVMHARVGPAHISSLLLVSPVRVLAGINVPDTLEFLLQLCDVCHMPGRSAKLAAVLEVKQKGDAALYASGVTFRKGLVLIQAIIRTFLRRRVGKRRELEIAPRLAGIDMAREELTMTVGTTFLKELADGRIYNGVIRSIQKNTYVLGYDQDPDAVDKVDEIEMRIILEESQRLSIIRESSATSSTNKLLSRASSRMRPDADISLSDLPDLSDPNGAQASRFMKRQLSSSQGLDNELFSTQSVLTRSQSQRPSKGSMSPFALVPSETILARKSSTALPSSIDECAAEPRDASRSALMPQGSFKERRGSKGSDWQNSLKKKLEEGREQSSASMEVPSTEVDSEASTPATKSTLQRKKQLAPVHPSSFGSAVGTPVQDRSSSGAHVPNFPKLGIPGAKPLGPVVAKKTLASSAPSNPGDSKNPGKAAQNTPSPASNNGVTRPVSLQRSSSTRSVQRVALAPTASSAAPATDVIVDTAFVGAYQTTDQRTQEKLALIRDVVLRIDSYMKRKRLRVIDLFRFCDADGNGSISPEEMIDTLSQMEIQLTADQTREFLSHIDKDGNGSIDIDEFEELVRVARRNEAQREQVKKELNQSRKHTTENKSSGKYNAVVKARQRILDEFKAAQDENDAGVTAGQLRSILERLALPGVDDTLISGLVDRAIATSTTNAGSSSSSSRPGSAAATSQAPSPRLATSSTAHRPNSRGVIHLHHLSKTLDDLEWAKKANRFLDQSWISQFDSQLERAIREFDLL